VAPGPSHRLRAKFPVFLNFPSGIPYATGLRHLISREEVMEKKSGKANQSGKRIVRDLPVSDAATPGVKGGSIFDAIGKAIGSVVKGVV